MNQATSLRYPVESGPVSRRRLRTYGPWLLLLALVGVMYAVAEQIPWAFKYPKAWVIPLRYWISDGMKWLYNDATFGLFTFKEFTRAISWLLEWPLTLAKSLLSTGFLQGQGFQQARDLGRAQAVHHEFRGAQTAAVELLAQQLQVALGMLSRFHGSCPVSQTGSGMGPHTAGV